MFEKTLERILKKYLAPYIDGISRDGLSILKGDLQLQNLTIKAEAFDFLKPYGVLLKSGRIGRLHIQIPWRQLTQGKISIELECIAVAVARIQGDIPDDATILRDNWQSKIAKVDKKQQELQELAETTGGGDENSGYVGRWMHRLAQNIQVAVSGGVMLQGFDTKQALSGGLLLDGLRVTSIGEASPDPKVATLQKQVEITNIAAYATVDDGIPRYVLEPTRLVLSVNHRASNLEAKLEMLDRQGRGHTRKIATGCRLAVSQRALFRLAVTVREMGAWQSHCQDVVTRHCRHVKTDVSSLQGETYQQYTQLYRKRQQGSEQSLSRDEEDTLQAIEEAVMSRHLARWRLEVSQALKTKQQTTRKGWRLFGGGKQENGVVDSDEWEMLTARIRDDQAHLADLDKPRTMAVSIIVQKICVQLYDDTGTPRPGPSSFQSIPEQTSEDQLNYADLVAGLDDFDVGTTIKHDLRLVLSQPQTSAKVTPRVVADYERSEWSFGVCFGTMEVWCDQEPVLRYISTDTKLLAGLLEPSQFKDVALWSRICDDGTELISASICLPPIQLCTAPAMLGVVMNLIQMDLPEPPIYGGRQKTVSESRINPETTEWYNLHGTYWEEWEDDFSQWKNDVVLEAAEQHAERVKESALVFNLDLDVSAPQLTVRVDGLRRIHVDLGHLRLKSDGVMKADDFKAQVELSDTQISCVSGAGPGGVEMRLPILEPISLAIAVSGKKPKGEPDAPLDLDLDVRLQRIQLGVYPKAVHVILDAPKVYMAVLNVKEEPQEEPALRRLSRRLSTARRSTLSLDKRPSQTVAEEAQPEVVAEPSATTSQYRVRATAAIQLISLGLYDMELDPVARIDVVDLQASGSSTPAQTITGGASMKHLLIEVMRKPVLQLRDCSQHDQGEALNVKVAMQADQPTTVGLKVCPVIVEWRKDSVRALIAAAASCSAPPRPGTRHTRSRDNELAEATLNQLSEAIEARGKERRGSLVDGMGRRSFVPPPRKSLVSVPPDDPSRQLAKQGLVAGEALPALQSEQATAASLTKRSLVVDAQFGGLLVKLHREEHERHEVIPVWRAHSGLPLLEWHAIDLSVKFEAFANQEARCKLALHSFSVLYDGHCIMSPWHLGTSIFESELKMYKSVEQGGPLHSICFQGMLRKLSIVFFRKHIDSLVFYLSSSVAGALVQKTAEDVKEAIEAPKSAESVALWNVFIESPIICLSRDPELRQYSPAWDGELEATLLDPKSRPGQQEVGDEFEDAAEHQTSMIEELQQYIIIYPGSINAKNTFQADGSADPPLVFSIGFSHTTIEAKDLIGPTTGSFLKCDNWELVVRLDSCSQSLPMHVSVGLSFKPISCDLTPERLTLVLDCVQEDILYQNYFPQPPVQAPEGVRGSEGPHFADSFGEELKVQSMVANVRINFEGLNVTLSKLSDSATDGQPLYEPVLGLVVGNMRLLVDCVLYYGGVPMALLFGIFLDSVVAEDLRPTEVRAHHVSTKLLGLQKEGSFNSADGLDDWILVPDREQGKRPYLPPRAALQLVFTIASATSSSLRFVLQQPKIYSLVKLATDAGDALSEGFAASTMAAFPPPPVPMPETEAQVTTPEPTASSLAVNVSVLGACLNLYTNYATCLAPVVQASLSVTTELTVGASGLKIKDVALSDLHVSRTEAQAEPEVGSSAMRARGTSSVKLFTLNSLHVNGEQRKLPRPELDLKVRAQPASMRLTTGDVPHLVAAITGLGGDGRRKKEVSTGAAAEEASIQNGAPEPAGAAGVERMGTLRLLVRGVEGALTLEGLWVTARFGDKSSPLRVPWGQPQILPVPLVQGMGVHRRAAEGPLLQLALHWTGNSKALGSLLLPVEICAGRGLDGSRVLQVPAPLPEAVASALATPAVAGRRMLELSLQATYEPGQDAGIAAGSISALCPPVASVQDFLKPCQQIEDFLQQEVPRLSPDKLRGRASRASMRRLSRKKSLVAVAAKSVAAAVSTPETPQAPPLAIRVLTFLEGFEASFLDDCQANVLPVLRLRLRAGSDEQGRDPASAPAQTSANRTSMIKFEMNPWGPKEQRLGLALGMENYFLGVNYLNARAGCWEPFLEPWAVDFFYSAYQGRKQGKDAAQSKAPADNPMLNAKYDAASEITLMSFGPLNVNITPQLCSLASFLLSNKEAYVRRLSEPGTAVEGAGGARYRLLNLANAPVCLAVIHEGPAAGGKERNSAAVPLDWKVFEPCAAEVPLDPLLGRRSAEEWRQLADEPLACLVGLLPAGGGLRSLAAPCGGAPREPLRVLLSSTCDGLISVPAAHGVGEHAACEVLLPHPSHHLMLVSGRCRVFNHTCHKLEVRFHYPGQEVVGSPLPASAAPMHVLPERLAYPPQIAAALRPGTEDGAVASLAPIRAPECSPSQSGEEVGPVPDEPDAQRLPPQHFCSAPLACAEADAALEVRLAGAAGWSEPLRVGTVACAEDVRGKALFVPGAEGALLRLRAYCSRGQATALHVCAPLRLLNATPVRLRFSFTLEDSVQSPISLEVDAFSDCDVSSELDPAQPFALSLALADRSVDVSIPGGQPARASLTSSRESPAVQHIFDTAQPEETIVPVPVARAEDTVDASAPSLGITVTHGLAVRASCSRWLVDRTGLGLRALCVAPGAVPAACATPLPQADDHVTLLDHLLHTESPRSRMSKHVAKKGQENYFLAVPSSSKGGWSCVAPVKLPDDDTAFTHATLSTQGRLTGNETSSDGHRLHVCLQAEAVSGKLTFGVPCQVISVLPQVVIYNELLDDALVVRAQGDPSTEVSVPAAQTGGFLRWNGDGNASGKSPLAVQFRPSKLSDSCDWSMPISFGVGEATGPLALALPLRRSSKVSRPGSGSGARDKVLRKQCSRTGQCAADLFTAEVAERGGVVCLTVKRGSRCELQNYSCLVETVTLRPLNSDQGDEEFSARSCETLEIAWPSAAARSKLEVCLAWSRAAGGSCSRGTAPDLRKPGQVLFPAPGGWQAVLVETGCTGDICWLRVQDVPRTALPGDSSASRAKGTSTAKLKVVVTIAHVGLSLVSPKREQELLYTEIRNVAALLGMWDSCLSLELCASNMQVDCQLVDYKDCPVVFANRTEPALQCKVIQQLPASKSGVGLDALGVSINALELSVNESFLSEVGEAVGDMLRPILSLEEVGREQIQAWKTEPLGGDFQVPPPVPALIDISQFTFLGLEVHLWASIRLAKLPPALRRALGVLTVGSDRLSIQGATLQLDPEVFDHIHGPAPTVAKIILQRYWANLLCSLASLLGRSTLLELPSLPLQWGRRGVEGGMCAINFLLTRTANVFEHCTLDKQYVRQKRPLLGRQVMEVTNLKTGVGAAGQHLAEGVMHVGDIIREPIEGARDAGVKGFAKGVGRGVMGTVVQPVLGAVYSVHALSRGVLIAVSKDGEGASQRKVPARRRPPRVMYAAGAIREYVETQPAGAQQ